MVRNNEVNIRRQLDVVVTNVSIALLHLFSSFLTGYVKILLRLILVCVKSQSINTLMKNIIV